MQGDHLARAIGNRTFSARFYGSLTTFSGRIAGQDGKTKFTIENASRTRIVLADTCVQPPFGSPHITGPNLILAPEKYTSLVHSKTSRLLETQSYLSSSDHRQERYTLACAQSAVECVNVRCRLGWIPDTCVIRVCSLITHLLSFLCHRLRVYNYWNFVNDDALVCASARAELLRV